jgi:hypothetical protein
MFGHITTGYDAGYYGYTYSLVFAADMYATVFAADPLDPARGQHYRESVLLPGGSRDEMASLQVSFFVPAGVCFAELTDCVCQAFLGREPNSEAFMRALFGSGKKAEGANANL